MRRLCVLATSSLLLALAGHAQAGSITSLSLSSDGALAAATVDGPSRLMVWDAKSGKLLSSTEYEDLFTAAFSPTQKLLFVATGAHVNVLDPTTLKMVRQLEEGRRVAFSPNGKLVVTDNEQLRLYETGGYQQIGQGFGERGRDPNFYVSNDQVVYMSAGSPCRTWRIGQRSAQSTSMDVDGNTIAVRADGKAVYAWGNNGLQMVDPAAKKVLAVGEQLNGSQPMLLVSAKYLIAVLPKEVRWYSASDLSPQGVWKDLPYAMDRVALSGDGRFLLAATEGQGGAAARFTVYAAEPGEARVVVKLQGPRPPKPSREKISDVEVVKPWAKRETVAPVEPDWCDDYDVGSSADSLTDLKRSRNTEDPMKGLSQVGYEAWLTYVGKIACEDPADPSVQKQVAAWRQVAVNYAGTTEAENRATIKLLLARGADKKEKQLQAQARRADGTPEEAALADATNTALFGSEALKRVDAERLLFWVDVPSKKVPELVRAELVWSCFAPTQNLPDRTDPDALARCGADARRLNVAAVDAEAKALGVNELGRLRAHTLAVAAKTSYETVVTAAVKTDPRYKPFYVDKLEQLFAGWESASYRPHQAIYDLAWEAEGKLWASPGAPPKLGCSEPLRQELVAYMTSLAPKTRDDLMRRVATDPYSSFLLEHAAMCAIADRDPIAASGWAGLQEAAGGYHARGPRYAVLAAVFQGSTVAPRDLGLRISMPSPLSKWVLDRVDGGFRVRDWEFEHEAQGTILALKKTPKGTLVTFKQEVLWQYQQECEKTNQVEHVFPSGNVVYKVGHCKPLPAKKIVIKPSPVTIKDAYTEGLKPGLWLRYYGRTVDGTDYGFPAELLGPKVGEKPGALLRYYGIPIAR